MICKDSHKNGVRRTSHFAQTPAHEELSSKELEAAKITHTKE